MQHRNAKKPRRQCLKAKNLFVCQAAAAAFGRPPKRTRSKRQAQSVGDYHVLRVAAVAAAASSRPQQHLGAIVDAEHKTRA